MVGWRVHRAVDLAPLFQEQQHMPLEMDLTGSTASNVPQFPVNSSQVTGCFQTDGPHFTSACCSIIKEIGHRP